MESALAGEDDTLTQQRAVLESRKAELSSMAEEVASESRNAGDMEAEFETARSQTESERKRYEAAMATSQRAEGRD